MQISSEHLGARWIDPWEYRDRYFGDDALVAAETVSPRHGELIRNVRANIDEYLAWRKLRDR